MSGFGLVLLLPSSSQDSRLALPLCAELQQIPRAGREGGSHQSRAQAGAVAVWRPISKKGIETFGQQAAPSVAPGWLPRIASTKRAYPLQFPKRQPPPIPRSTKMEQQFKHHIYIGGYKWHFNSYYMFMGIKRDEATHFILCLPTQNICLWRKKKKSLNQSTCLR